MSLRVRSVSGRSLVPCPPTRMTAGKRHSDGAADAFVDEAERAHLLGIEQVAPVDDHVARHAAARGGPVELS